MKTSTGLKSGKMIGNFLEKIFEKTGIAARADKYSRLTGKDCGCEKRHKIIDKLFPF